MMKSLQDIFDACIQDQFSFKNLGVEIIEKRVNELGVHLTKPQRTALRKKLRKNTLNKLSLALEENQIPAELLKNRKGKNAAVPLDLGDPVDIVNALVKDFSKKIPSIIEEIIEKISPQVHNDLKNGKTELLKDHRRDVRRFESNLKLKWGAALDLLEMLILLATDAGGSFNDAERPKARKNDFVLEALTRLQARACQVAIEILKLLKGGFADGAHARWRCLHEIAVVGIFISEKGREAARRYIHFEAIESYKEALQYQTYCKLLGHEPLGPEELEDLRIARDDLVNRFGKNYGGEYGWAANVLKKDRVTFRDLEEKVNLEHIRPFYKLASYNVHASPKGVYSKLGLDPNSSDMLLAGPSNLGLEEPGHSTAISLSQITVTLITSKPNLDRLLTCDLLMKIKEETREAFFAGAESLQE